MKRFVVIILFGIFVSQVGLVYCGLILNTAKKIQETKSTPEALQRGLNDCAGAQAGQLIGTVLGSAVLAGLATGAGMYAAESWKAFQAAQKAIAEQLDSLLDELSTALSSFKPGSTVAPVLEEVPQFADELAIIVAKGEADEVVKVAAQEASEAGKNLAAARLHVQEAVSGFEKAKQALNSAEKIVQVSDDAVRGIETQVQGIAANYRATMHNFNNHLQLAAEGKVAANHMAEFVDTAVQTAFTQGDDMQKISAFLVVKSTMDAQTDGALKYNFLKSLQRLLGDNFEHVMMDKAQEIFNAQVKNLTQDKIVAFEKLLKTDEYKFLGDLQEKFLHALSDAKTKAPVVQKSVRFLHSEQQSLQRVLGKATERLQAAEVAENQAKLLHDQAVQHARQAGEQLAAQELKTVAEVNKAIEGAGTARQAAVAAGAKAVQEAEAALEMAGRNIMETLADALLLVKDNKSRDALVAAMKTLAADAPTVGMNDKFVGILNETIIFIETTDFTTGIELAKKKIVDFARAQFAQAKTMVEEGLTFENIKEIIAKHVPNLKKKILGIIGGTTTTAGAGVGIHEAVDDDTQKKPAEKPKPIVLDPKDPRTISELEKASNFYKKGKIARQQDIAPKPSPMNDCYKKLMDHLGLVIDDKYIGNPAYLLFNNSTNLDFRIQVDRGGVKDYSIAQPAALQNKVFGIALLHIKSITFQSIDYPELKVQCARGKAPLVNEVLSATIKVEKEGNKTRLVATQARGMKNAAGPWVVIKPKGNKVPQEVAPAPFKDLLGARLAS